MPTFEVNIICTDGEICCNFVKQHMENFSEIIAGKNHPFELVGKVYAKDFRDIIRIIKDLKKNTGGLIEDISVNALEK